MLAPDAPAPKESPKKEEDKKDKQDKKIPEGWKPFLVVDHSLRPQDYHS